ncbi:MAG: pyruvate kinase [Thiohalomonadaceae bacterium]
MDTQADYDELVLLLDEMLAMREQIVLRANRQLNKYRDAGVHHDPSACNLAIYLALREEDRRSLQVRLAEWGLSSLGRCEPHVMANIDAIIRILMRATGTEMRMMMSQSCPLTRFAEGSHILENHTSALFGPASDGRETRIMVTLPAEAAYDDYLIPKLLASGTDCVRINCAHDDASIWAALVMRVRQASAKHGRACRILMDLAGHKLRTAGLPQRPAVIHLKVQRNPYGQIQTPAMLQLIPDGSPFVFIPAPGVQQLTLPADWFAQLRQWDSLSFTDTRGKPRHIELNGALKDGEENGAWQAICPQPAWLGADCVITRHRTGEEPLVLGQLDGQCLPQQSQAITVHVGERFLLQAGSEAGMAACLGEDGSILSEARIGCTLPEVLTHPRSGEMVWIDDGKIGCVVEESSEQGLWLRVTHCSPKGARIQADKGINFPDTALQLPPLSDKDLADLDFVCQHADMVGFSFVESDADMQVLASELQRRGCPDMPIIAKIESSRAVRNLPEILLGNIAQRRIGIMIARGDLAVELGSVRMAEIQEEILWICEAAHVPVIWATQVLESIAKKGVRSRPEFTDAAMGVRAECVMLNKGAYVADAVQALDKVLAKMQDHQRKKVSQMRALHLDW